MTSDASQFPDRDPTHHPPLQPGADLPPANRPPGRADAGTSPKPAGGVSAPNGPGVQAPAPVAHTPTRAGAAWAATAVALVLLVLLIILILQNQNVVQVHYLGFAGSISLGTALLIAAVAGAAVVAIVGVIRLTQLRLSSRRKRQSKTERGKENPRPT